MSRLSSYSPIATAAVGLAAIVLVAAALPTGAVPTGSVESTTAVDEPVTEATETAEAAGDTAEEAGDTATSAPRDATEPALDAPLRDDSALTRIDRHAFPFGTDLAFEGDLVVAGSANWLGRGDSEIQSEDSGIRLYKRRRNGTLSQRSFLHCPSWHADVDFVPNTPDDDEHRRATPRYVALAHDDGEANECEPGGGKAGVGIIDVRAPRKPKPVGFAETIHGSHNLTAVGDTGLVYVSSYDLEDPTAEAGVSIVDVEANPEDPPVTFLEFPGAQATGEHPEIRNEADAPPTSPGCHDIGLDLDQNLAFCAGITETQIWDISNPRDPVILEIIHAPQSNIDHAAETNADGDVLILNDEWAGAAGGSTGCLTPRAVTGALWFYDISDPTEAKLLGQWSPPEPDPVGDFTCTSHFFGTFEDDAGEDRLVASWYDHGVWVVDFENPRLPTAVAALQPEGETFWAAYPYKGTLYANSFAPATPVGSEDDPDAGGLWALELDGYTGDRPGRSGRGPP